MHNDKNKKLGAQITRLLRGEDLDRQEAFDAFAMVLANEVTEMQQGGFLAALTGKGETADEVAGGWQAVYALDTNKVDLADLPLVENCGTGMDTFKTFNISTAAAVVAAAGGVKIARHGARAITSVCGTVDMAESLGVDVECPVDLVAKSIRDAGIGLFNGMSGEVHPRALGRILSQISFGSPLHIAASLAHPALPRRAVRGVYSRDLLVPVAEVMHRIGYTDALVVFGAIDGAAQGMDEASVCGTTFGARLKNGKIDEFELTPESCGLPRYSCESLRADSDREEAARHMYELLAGNGDPARQAAVILNAALIFLVAGQVDSVAEGVGKAGVLLQRGDVLATLRRWVVAQHREPAKGLARLSELAGMGVAA
jgi:anthranilate phosphoribosyltransferase